MERECQARASGVKWLGADNLPVRGSGSAALATGRVDRRLTAILAADIAGYSRLMGADEEGTLTGLTAHRREQIDPKISEHRGRIVKATGDSLLVEFARVVDTQCAAQSTCSGRQIPPRFQGRAWSNSMRSETRAGLGHEDQFPPPRLSACGRFSQGTFARTRGNGRDAP